MSGASIMRGPGRVADAAARSRWNVQVRSRYIPRRQPVLRVAQSILASGLLNLARPNSLSVPERAIFLVGCGHSGTTLLASRFGQHPEIWLVPHESYAFLPQNGLHAASRMFIEWSYVARSRGQSIVLEKTPKHVHCATRIRRLIPNADFVVASRHPVDTVASLYRRTGSLPDSIWRWNKDSEASLRLVEGGSPLVRHEDLCASPAAVLQGTLDALGIDWDAAVLASGSSGFGAEVGGSTMSLRNSQVRADIAMRARTWSEVLTLAETRRVIRETRALGSALGHSMEDL